MWLYQATGKESYLEHAKKTYDVCCSPNKVGRKKGRAGGEDALWLYRAMEKESYLEHAKKTYDTFCSLTRQEY